MTTALKQLTNLMKEENFIVVVYEGIKESSRRKVVVASRWTAARPSSVSQQFAITPKLVTLSCQSSGTRALCLAISFFYEAEMNQSI